MFLRLIPICAFLAMDIAAAQSPAADPILAEALESFQRAREGDSREVERSVTAFERLAQAEPQQPLFTAYLGSALSMRGRDAWMPWNKLKYVEQGLDRIDRALAALRSDDDTRMVRGVPVSIETRFVAANTLLQIPDEIFHRREQGGKTDRGAARSFCFRAGIGNSVKMIPVAEVCYFQAADKYTNVVTREADALIRTSLKELLAQLPADRFVQIHRATVVNLDEVRAAIRDDAGRVSLALKHRAETLPVSRVFAHLFRQM